MTPLTGQALINQLLEVLAFFNREFPEDHPYESISPSPHPSLRPDLFMRLQRRRHANRFPARTWVCLAGQINPSIATPVLKKYRENFRPSQYLSKPYSILSTIIVVCAETDEEARYLARPAELQWARWGTGQIHHPPPTLDEAQTHTYTAGEDAARREAKGRFVIGTPARVKAERQQLATEAQIDELMTVNMITDHQAQLKSYRLPPKPLI